MLQGQQLRETLLILWRHGYIRESIIMMQPHFEFQLLDASGKPYGLIYQINTVLGVLNNCPLGIDRNQVKHLCEIARVTPDYPVDLTHFVGPENDRRLQWSARIYWRTGHANH